MIERRLQIFSKAPQAGAVKTRMQPWLSPQQAAELHAILSEWTVTRLVNDRWRSELWCAPRPDLEFFQRLAGAHACSLQRQQGQDLGARMGHALQQALCADCHAVIVGTDCPQLDRQHIDEMFTALADGQEAVIIPAQDGGYVALGLRRFAPALFTAIPWGTDMVYEFTTRALNTLGWSWRALPALPDVDTPEDVRRLLQMSAASPFLRRLESLVARRSTIPEHQP